MLGAHSRPNIRTRLRPPPPLLGGCFLMLLLAVGAFAVRKRPLNKKEIENRDREKDVVQCVQNEAVVREPKLKVDLTKYTEEHHFLFDRTFNEDSTNEDLYHQSVRPLVEAAFNGARCTCFAYGQTGSGKTYTMMGPGQRSVDSEGRRFYDDEGERTEESESPPKGIFLLAAEDFFDLLKGREQELGVIISFYEIYCGKLFDLLNRRQLLHARENAKNKVVIVGLTETQVSNVQEVMHVIEFGLQARTTGVTGANIDSSRSHAILQITLKDITSTSEAQPIHGQVSFIDLAGSERGANTLDQDRQTRLDGAEINKSLLALKECIRALDQQLEHTPFRGSKLTQVLKDSFVGDYCRTVMIATVSPTAGTVEHTLNTLRYAYRVKELQDRGGDRGNNRGAAGEVEGKRHYSPPVRLVDDADRSGLDEQPPRLPVTRSGSTAFDPESTGQTPAANGQYGGSSSSSSSAAPSKEKSPTLKRTPRSTKSPYKSMVAPVGKWVPQLRELQGGGTKEEFPELRDLVKRHDQLISLILQEEEELIASHRGHIDSMVDLVKEEMVYINHVDRPGSDVDAYVAGLEHILNLKTQYIEVEDIRSKVQRFQEHLREEDALSKKFQERKMHLRN
eukprot:g7960.t1